MPSKAMGMVDTDGGMKHDIASIVEVFATFYAQLYRSRQGVPTNGFQQSRRVASMVLEFDAAEWRTLCGA